MNFIWEWERICCRDWTTKIFRCCYLLDQDLRGYCGVYLPVGGRDFQNRRQWSWWPKMGLDLLWRHAYAAMINDRFVLAFDAFDLSLKISPINRFWKFWIYRKVPMLVSPVGGRAIRGRGQGSRWSKVCLNLLGRHVDASMINYRYELSFDALDLLFKISPIERFWRFCSSWNFHLDFMFTALHHDYFIRSESCNRINIQLSSRKGHKSVVFLRSSPPSVLTKASISVQVE